MDELDGILSEATAAIDAPYFLLPIAGGESVYRERVYCYELYHQMRCLWPTGECPFLLNGEVDKRAHAGLEALGVRGQKPDLLVHTPGDMRGNCAAIEVKPANASRQGIAKKAIAKDLGTLALFLNHVGYKRGVYLIYGVGADERLATRIKSVASEIEGGDRIEIWLHPAVHHPASKYEDR